MKKKEIKVVFLIDDVIAQSESDARAAFSKMPKHFRDMYQLSKSEQVGECVWRNFMLPVSYSIKNAGKLQVKSNL